MLNPDQIKHNESAAPIDKLHAIGVLASLSLVGDMGLLSNAALIVAFACVIIIFIGLLILMVYYRRNLALRMRELEKSESRLQSMEDRLPDMAFFQLIHSDTGPFQFTRLSDGVESVLGLDSRLLMSDAQTALNHIYVEDVPLLKESMIRGEVGGTPVNLEFRLLDMDGNQRWFQLSAFPHREKGTTIWDGCLQNITVLKKTEREIMEENRNLKLQFENIDDFLLVCSADGRILHVNPSVESRLGRTMVELRSMSVFDLSPQGTRNEIQQTFKRIGSVHSSTSTFLMQTKAGTLISVEMNFFQGRWEKHKAIIGVGHDIARRKLTESALHEAKYMLQMIIDTIPMCVFWKNKESTYLGCNKAFADERGVDDIDDVLGKNPFDLFDPSVAKDIVDRDQLVVNTNQAVVNLKETYARTDGRPGWREISKIPLRNADGDATGVLGVWRDVTEQNMADERLKQTLKDIERFNQLMRGRERRTLELKSEINHLLSELGQDAKYKTTLDDLT